MNLFAQTSYAIIILSNYLWSAACSPINTLINTLVNYIVTQAPFGRPFVLPEGHLYHGFLNYNATHGQSLYKYPKYLYWSL